MEPQKAANTTQILTKREREILELFYKGHSSKSSGQLLGITYKTVDVFCNNLYRKLNVTKKGEAVYKALKLRLIKDK